MVRIKSRYLLCEVCVSDRKSRRFLEEKNVYQAVRDAVLRAHGEHGVALYSIGSSVTYVNAYTGIVMIRFRKAHYRLLWSALPFINSVYSQGQTIRCFFNCIHVGGTIRTCQKFLVRYGRQQLCRMLPLCKSEAEKREVRKVMLSCSRAEGLTVHHDDDEEQEDEEI